MLSKYKTGTTNLFSKVKILENEKGKSLILTCIREIDAKNITATIMIKASNKELESKYSLLRDFISKHIKNGFRLYINVGKVKYLRYRFLVG